MRQPALSILIIGSVLALAGLGKASDAIRIGSGLELFIDDYLIERFAGGAHLTLHRPERREIVFETDAPWEGNACGYESMFKDGDVYRMYYRGAHYPGGPSTRS